MRSVWSSNCVVAISRRSGFPTRSGDARTDAGA
jgi:hypothetical protein